MSRKKTARKKRRLRAPGAGSGGFRNEQVLAENRRARRNFVILEQFEAGVALTGAEVKSCRSGGANLKDAYGRERNGELFLVNCHIAPYVNAPPEQGNPERNRKLLLHENEMQRIAGKLTMAGLTLVPLRIHLRNGWIKVQVALAKGKSTRDRRETIKQREAAREVREALG